MAVIGTFGSFTTARLGLYAAQGSLNVTGNNIANINTKGYTRQRMDLVSLNATGQAKYANSFMVDVGYGVLCERTTQLRDPFLDIRYRDKNSQLGQVEQWQSGLDELASILDEVNRGKDDFGIIENQMGDFLTQLQNLLDRVGNEEYDDLVRSSANTLCKFFNTAYDDIEKIQEGREDLLKEQVDKANGLLTEIRDLNKQIREHSIYGDSALELRDARNLALDELSSLMHINVEYSMEKIDQYTEVEKLTVTLADSTGSDGQPIKLVDGVFGTQLMMPKEVPAVNPDYPKSGGMYLTKTTAPDGTVTYGTTNDLEIQKLDVNGDPEFDVDGNPVMIPNPDLLMVNSFKDKDELEASTLDGPNHYLFQLDSLKDENGRLYRDKWGKEIDTQEYIGDTVMTGGLQAIRELLTEEGVFAGEDDIAIDPEATAKRGIPYYLSALNSFAYKFAEVMNEANQMDPKEVYYTNADGNFSDADGNAILFTANGGTGPINANFLDQLSAKELEGCLAALRENGVLKPDYDYYDGGVLFSNRDDNNDPSGINASNISVSAAWKDGTVRILQTKEPNRELGQSTNGSNIQHMITLFKGEQHFIPTDVQPDAASGLPFFKGPFQNYFTDIAGRLAADSLVTNGQYINYSTEALDLENSRQSVSGVDLNDEATNMIQFSKAYSAACRLMTTIDSMLDKLINGTAV